MVKIIGGGRLHLGSKKKRKGLEKGPKKKKKAIATDPAT